jgi:hypothetical protein
LQTGKLAVSCGQSPEKLFPFNSELSRIRFYDPASAPSNVGGRVGAYYSREDIMGRLVGEAVDGVLGDEQGAVGRTGLHF